MLKNNKDSEAEKSAATGTGFDSASASASVNRTVNTSVDGCVSEKSIEQTLCGYISNTLLSSENDVVLGPDDDLLTIDCLDSMQFMRLAQYIEKTYQLNIPAEDLLIENFQTVQRLTHYLSRRMSGA